MYTRKAKVHSIHTSFTMMFDEIRVTQIQQTRNIFAKVTF
jgi:hypothetical protein